MILHGMIDTGKCNGSLFSTSYNEKKYLEFKHHAIDEKILLTRKYKHAEKSQQAETKQMLLNMLKNPNWQKLTGWPFTA